MRWKSIRQIVVAVALAIAAAAFPTIAAADDEVTLYDSSGAASAYIVFSSSTVFSDTPTIYLWDGTPSAFLDRRSETDVFHVYSFGGEHLGWFEGGILWNHDGDAEGAVRTAISGPVQIEQIKSIKQIKPIRGIENIPPIKPLYTYRWSPMTLSGLLDPRPLSFAP